jgi:hypothetical protein
LKQVICLAPIVIAASEVICGEIYICPHVEWPYNFSEKMYFEIKATFKGSYVHVVPPLKKQSPRKMQT